MRVRESVSRTTKVSPNHPPKLQLNPTVEARASLAVPPLLARCHERSSIDTIGSAQGNFRPLSDPSKDLEVGRGRIQRLVQRTVSHGNFMHKRSTLLQRLLKILRWRVLHELGCSVSFLRWRLGSKNSLKHSEHFRSTMSFRIVFRHLCD